MQKDFENLLILKFETAKEVADFIKDIELKDKEAFLNIYDIAPYEAWLFVEGICDVCGKEQMFFIPASAYEDEILGVECSECENMSVFPKKGGWYDA